MEMKQRLTGFVTHPDGRTLYHGNGDITPTCWADDMKRSCEEVLRRRRLNEGKPRYMNKELTLF